MDTSGREIERTRIEKSVLKSGSLIIDVDGDYGAMQSVNRNHGHHCHPTTTTRWQCVDIRISSGRFRSRNKTKFHEDL